MSLETGRSPPVAELVQGKSGIWQFEPDQLFDTWVGIKQTL
jgi:hypothetical protein